MIQDKRRKQGGGSTFCSLAVLQKTRQPLIFASCPTTIPTDPAAAETNTSSPGLGFSMIMKPIHAVKEGAPIPN